MYQVLITGLGLGLLSSLHCIGMCGPIALSLPVHRFFGWERFTRIFSYHAGRIITYSTLGFLFGWFGRGLHVAGLQQWVSIVSGILILLFLVQEYIFRATVFPLFMQRFRSFTQGAMGRLLKGKTPQDLLLMGMINGLLPCAMIYIAVAGSLNGGTVFLSTLNSLTLPVNLPYFTSYRRCLLKTMTLNRICCRRQYWTYIWYP